MVTYYLTDRAFRAKLPSLSLKGLMETEVWCGPIRGTSPINSVNRINVLMSILIIGSRKTSVSRPEIAVEIIDYIDNKYRGVIDGLHARQ